MSLGALGRMVQIGMPAGAHVAPALALDRVYSRQLSLHGTRGMPSHRFPALFELIDTGAIDLESMVAGRIALEQVNDALQDLTTFRGAGIKVIAFQDTR